MTGYYHHAIIEFTELGVELVKWSANSLSSNVQAQICSSKAH